MKFVHTADTHLGFEVTKVAQSDPQGRRRRAESIFANFLSVLDHAGAIEAHALIHSGDLFNKNYIPREALDNLIEPIMRFAKEGASVLIIPGNHERSEFPFDLFHGAANIYVFDRPKSVFLTLDGYSIGFAGFPFIRDDSRRTFLRALEETEYGGLRSDFNILVTHQAFDEATVGPGNYVFRAGRKDTVSRQVVPSDFEYIAAGHIHRYQILPHPLRLGLNFVYPGSTQRISFAEMDEEKGFVEGEVIDGRIATRFIPLPTYAMEMVEMEAAGLTAAECEAAIRGQYWRCHDDLVLRFKLTGGSRKGDYPDIDVEKIRREIPDVIECQFAMKVGGKWIQI